MITSQNRPGLPDFSRVTLKNMGRPGDVWRAKRNKNQSATLRVRALPRNIAT